MFFFSHFFCVFAVVELKLILLTVAQAIAHTITHPKTYWVKVILLAKWRF
jgi:hypothetical protein